MVTTGWTRRSGLAMAGAAAIVACGPQPGAQPSESRPAATAGASSVPPNRRFKIGVSFEVSNMSPHDSGFWLTSYGTGQSLLRVSPEEKLEPWIAQSITAEGTEGYTIKLNPGAKFHNGKPIDARQVQAAIQRHLDAGVRSIPSLKGAAWESPDAQTLRIRTVEPDPWLPNYLALAYLPIFDTDEVPEPGKLNADALNALVGKGFYSGPFKVTKLTPQEMTMDAVPDAWDGAPRLAGVDVRFIKDAQARIAALKTGEIDMMLYIPGDAVPLIRQTPGLQFKKNDAGGRWRFYFNNQRPPFNEVAVRQAVALSINRKQIADNVMNGAHGAPDTIYPEAMPWAVKGFLKTDEAAAKKLLDDAGWRTGADGVRVKEGKRLAFEILHYPQQPDSKTMSEAIQAQFKALGMEVRLKQVDDINAALRSKDFDAGIGSGGMQSVGSPISILNTMFMTGARDNYGGWGNAQTDDIIRRLNTEFDANRRTELLKQFQEYLSTEVPITFVTSRPWAVAVNEEFRDYQLGVDVDHYIVRKELAPSPKK